MEALPALVAGNTAVIKPAQDTPLSTLNFVKTLHDAGIPAGVVNIVTGFGGEVGTPMVEHPEVRAVSLTGSTAVGRSSDRKRPRRSSIARWSWAARTP